MGRSVQDENATVNDCRDSENQAPLQVKDTQTQSSNLMNSAESHFVNEEPLTSHNSPDSHDATSKNSEASSVSSLEHGAHPSSDVNTVQNSVPPSVSSVSVTPMVPCGSPDRYNATGKKTEES